MNTDWIEKLQFEHICKSHRFLYDVHKNNHLVELECIQHEAKFGEFVRFTNSLEIVFEMAAICLAIFDSKYEGLLALLHYPQTVGSCLRWQSSSKEQHLS